jgi:acetate---CoA ligase (ADP-forming)
MSALDPLFAPQAIAVLGASATPGKLGAAMTESLASFPGPVMKVNAARPNPQRGFHPTVADAAKAYGITPDLVVSCIPAAVTADALREAAAAGARTVLVGAGGFTEVGEDGEDDVPCADTPASGSVMVRALVEDAAARARLGTADVAATSAPAVVPPSGPVDEHTAKGLPAEMGIRTPERRVCADPAAAHAALDDLDGPVVVKILDAKILHKTEVRRRPGRHARKPRSAGRADAPCGTRTHRRHTPRPGVRPCRGPGRSPSWPWAQGAQPPKSAATSRCASRPLSAHEANAMLDEPATRELFLGARGVAPVDGARLTQVLLALSSLAADRTVGECEINPLRILPDGDVVALDAILLLRV